MLVVLSAVTEALRGVLPDPEEKATGSARDPDVSGGGGIVLPLPACGPAVGEWPCQVQGTADRRKNSKGRGGYPCPSTKACSAWRVFWNCQWPCLQDSSLVCCLGCLQLCSRQPVRRGGSFLRQTRLVWTPSPLNILLS